jgi:RecA-family ATPase
MTNEAAKKQERKSNPFKVLNALEKMNKAPEKIPSLVDDLFLEVGVSMLCAKPKTGKSTLALQLAVAVAENTDFFDKTTLHGDVLYLGLEGPEAVVWQNLKKLGYTSTRGTIHVVHGHTTFDG